MQEGTYRYHVTYSRSGTICYLGHLEFLQIIFRALRRAKIRTRFSKGFNPSPKVSFSPALPVGTQSSCESFIMELPAPLDSCRETGVLLTRVLPDGISINEIVPFQGKLPQELITIYTVILENALSAQEEKRINSFLAAKTFYIARERRGKVKQLDIRALIAAIQVESTNKISLTITTRSGMPGIKPLKALEHILKRDEQNLLSSLVQKTASEKPDQ